MLSREELVDQVALCLHVNFTLLARVLVDVQRLVRQTQLQDQEKRLATGVMNTCPLALAN